MSKKEIKKKSSAQPMAELKPLVPVSSLFYLSSYLHQAIAIFIIGFIFYANSLKNEYALDDGIVIEKNEYVQDGFKGIGKIMSTDAYDSFYSQMGAKQQLTGGRYRPLSIVTFAIEEEFFGNRREGQEKSNIVNNLEKVNRNPTLEIIRHLNNVLLFLISGLLLLYFLRMFVFRSNPDIAFLITLLFIIHPIHTEAIANAKSRDEIMSFLFIIGTFIAVFHYQHSKKIYWLITSIIAYFFALLSKEYGVTLMVLIPVALYLFLNFSLGKSLKASLPFFLTGFLYLFIRYQIVGSGAKPSTEILNNPYLYATATQKIATKIFVLGKYLGLLFFPHPLSADYSYNQIAYKNFSNPGVLLSLFTYLTLGITTIVLLVKKHPLAFALLFYLLHLFLIGNVLMDIGATMGERLIYHSSFGFTMAIGYFIVKGFGKIILPDSRKKIILQTALLLLCIPAAWKTMERNAAWKNDITLFTNDVKVVPNSALANGNAGARYLDLSELPDNKNRQQELIGTAIGYLKKSIEIHPQYVNSFLNLGLAYFKLNDLQAAETTWKEAQKLYPTNPILKNFLTLLGNTYLNKAFEKGKEKDLLGAIVLMEKGAEIDSGNATIWYNIGGACFTAGQYDKAREAWTKALQINPAFEEVKKGMAALDQLKNN